jgi:AraC-like DNA-binding protein
MVENTPVRLSFSTDALPERDRFPAFCEEMIRRYAALDIQLRDDSRFRGAIEMQRAGAVAIGHIETTPTDYVRSPSLVRDGDDALCIVLCRNGGAYQTQRDNGQTLAAGEGIICDSGHVGAIHVTANSRFWSLKIPRPRITSILPRRDRLAGAKLDRDPVARRLLFGYLAGTLDVDLNGGGRAVALYDEHIVDLIALTLGAEGEAREIVEQRGVRAVRRSAVFREIEARLRDPALSAAAIAIRLGITPRYVHLLLEESGRTFTAHVLERRLEKIAEVLRDPRQHERRIADIALAAGFADLSHFNRTFRRRYGATPSEMRMEARRRDSD